MVNRLLLAAALLLAPVAAHAQSFDPNGNLRVTSGPSARTIPGLDAYTVVTGGTAVTAIAAGHRTAGGFIFNPPTATAPLCINEQTTAGTTSSNGTSCISPGTQYGLAASTNAVSVNATDSGHVFSGEGLN